MLVLCPPEPIVQIAPRGGTGFLPGTNPHGGASFLPRRANSCICVNLSLSFHRKARALGPNGYALHCGFSVVHATRHNAIEVLPFTHTLAAGQNRLAAGGSSAQIPAFADMSSDAERASLLGDENSKLSTSSVPVAFCYLSIALWCLSSEGRVREAERGQGQATGCGFPHRQRGGPLRRPGEINVRLTRCP